MTAGDETAGDLTLADRLRARDTSAAPAALNLIETAGAAAEVEALLAALSPAALGAESPAHIIGLTGPPGAGKSSLLSRLIAVWRERGRSVAVLAVDPSSRRSGGSLLGDRARIERDAGDRDVFIRSTAAGGRLGGLAPATRAAAAALAVAFDIVVIETVGVGQSETDVADLADTVAVVVQPGAGDLLQFLKAGIMEIPDVLAVTKSDLGDVAARTLADLVAALQALGSAATPALGVSAIAPPVGIAELAQALDEHQAGLELGVHRARQRRAQALADFAVEHGEWGLRALGGRRGAQRRLDALDGRLDAASLRRALEREAGR